MSYSKHLCDLTPSIARTFKAPLSMSAWLVLSSGVETPLSQGSFRVRTFSQRAWKDALTGRGSRNIGAALFLTLNEILCVASHRAGLSTSLSSLPGLLSCLSAHSCLAFLPGPSESWRCSGLCLQPTSPLPPSAPHLSLGFSCHI